MIKKEVVSQIVNNWLEGKEYFLVDINIDAQDKITVEIDHAEGVWIDDCVELSRFIESHLSRDEEDYELEVGSAGIGQPFKVLKQYEVHCGKQVETMTLNNIKMSGILKEVGNESFILSIEKKVKPEGCKRPKWITEDVCLKYEDVKYTKYVISFK